MAAQVGKVLPAYSEIQKRVHQNQLNSLHIFSSDFFKIYFDILPTMLMSFRQCLP
jgi:hypothetical protein